MTISVLPIYEIFLSPSHRSLLRPAADFHPEALSRKAHTPIQHSSQIVDRQDHYSSPEVILTPLHPWTDHLTCLYQSGNDKK